MLLDERAALLNGHLAPGHDRAELKWSAALAQRRAEKWTQQRPFNQEHWLDKRLGYAQLDYESFLTVVGLDTTHLQTFGTTQPHWLQQLDGAYAMPSSETGADAEVYAVPTLGYLEFARPVVVRAVQRLLNQLQPLLVQPGVCFDSYLVKATLLTRIAERLPRIAGRTMILELNVARVQGHLSGDTPEQRFESFVQRLSQSENAQAIVQEYPVLARLVENEVALGVERVADFFTGLANDWADVCKTFSPDHDPGKLIEVDSSASDPHNGGRSVMIAKFASGMKLVYKPRSLAVDVHFQELLVWLNARNADIYLRPIAVLDRGDHGWVEFAREATCQTETEVQRFYERVGAYLALLYALDATDFHYENLIAAGEHPVLIDLEAMFHHHLGKRDDEGGVGDERNETASAVDRAEDLLDHSVRRIGFLPKAMPNVAQGIIDTSGLGGQRGQFTPKPVQKIVGALTDEMHIVRERVKFGGGHHRPRLRGEEVDTTAYLDDILRGFTHMYGTLLAEKAALVAADGPLLRFKDDTIRIIFRATQTYMKLLSESYHPDLMRNALDREAFLDKLWMTVEVRPWMANLIAGELGDLHLGDTPMFTSQPNSTLIYGCDGQAVEGFVGETGLTSALRRCAELSAEDLERQRWIISASLSMLGKEADAPAKQINLDDCKTARPDEFVAAASQIGDWLAQYAIHAGDEACWLGLDMADERGWSVTEMDTDVYNGLAGVALFLGHLGRVTGEARHMALARQATNALVRGREDWAEYIERVGGFSGLGAMMYALSHLGLLLEDTSLLDAAHSIVAYLPGRIQQDVFFDVIGGSAGCIGSLLALDYVSPSAAALNAARACGDHLLANAKPQTTGIGWLTQAAPVRPLAGFSHGNAGFAWALSELAAATGDARYSDAAMQAIAYERSLYSAEARNWLDVRPINPEPNAVNAASLANEPATEANAPTPDVFRVAWCHGAPGIALGRLRMLQRGFGDAQFVQEIRYAIATTMAYPLGRNHSLCHGDLGNLDILRQGAEVLGDEALRNDVVMRASAVLAQINKHGWRCATPNAVTTPGLMIGLAGIGMGLLQFAAPGRVPSVLTLDALSLLI